MLDSVRDLAILVAALAGAPVAVATALRLPTLGRPARYLAKVLITDPLAAAIHPLIVQAVEESSVLQEIDRAVNTRDPGEPTISDDVAEIRDQMAEIKDQVAEAVDRLERGDKRFDELAERLEEVADG